MNTSLDKILETQPEWLSKEMKDIVKHDNKVKKALENQDMRAQFLKDPRKFLKKLNIPLSGKVKSLIRKNVQTLQELQKPHYLELENGQVIKVNIKVNIK